MKKSLFSVIMIVVFIGTGAIADTISVPPLINYQGVLTDAEGKPIANGQKNLEFNIYDAATGGTLIWGPQTFNTVPIINGQFNVILGTTDSSGRSILDAFDSDLRFLGIKIGESGVEISPRQQILSTPYATSAKNANLAETAEKVIDNAITTQMIADGAVTREKKEPVNLIKSGTISGEVSHHSEAYQVISKGEVTLEVTITTTGRPVFVGVEKIAANICAVLRIMRSTEGVDTEVTRTMWVHNNAMPASPWGVDQPPAGTHTYRVETSAMCGGDPASTIHGRLVALEL